MQRNRTLILAARIAALCALLGTSGAAQSQAITLVAARDNTIYSASPLLSNGAGQHLFAGVSVHTSSTRRGLLYFDIAGSVPAGSLITRADLRLHMSQTIAGPVDVRLHRALADWGEGTSMGSGGEGGGGAVTTGDATWTRRFHPSTPWTTAGGDFVASASASSGVDSDGIYRWSSNATLVADVQSWLDASATNFGWFVVNADEATQPTAKRFDTRENSTPEFRPRLTLEFIAPTCGTVTSYCVAIANSTGGAATLAASGSTSLAANSLSLQVASLPAGATHVFLIGASAVQVPFGDGFRCVAGSLTRLGPPSNADALGNGSRTLDFNAAPIAGTVTAGDARNFQCWFRDPAAGGTGSQLSDAISVSFCP
ncbi:MAG: DNRLRE domain-containing protein [Planctomycetota bacterium]|nr:DNRLRE domain-containing protein [Planctomycetota bacterium]